MVTSCYRHAGTKARGRDVLDLSPFASRAMMEILLESGARRGVYQKHATSEVDPHDNQSSSRPYSDHIHHLAGAVSHPPFKRTSFDVVLAFFCFRGDRQDDDILRACRRLLTPNGIVLAAVPNAGWGGLSVFDDVDSFEPERFSELIARSFSNHELLGQRLRHQNPLVMRKASPLSLVIPLALKDSLSRLVRNRPYFPGEYDFRFVHEVSDSAVLLAIANA